MKADATQLRSLLDLAGVDAELSRIAHRAGHLAEQQRYEQLQTEHREANDRVAVLRIAIEDLDGEVGRLESEIDSVRKREDRDRTLLGSPDTNAKQLSELQHELETLQRRQTSLEDTLLEVMERREQLQGAQADELAAVDGVQRELTDARQALDAAIADIDRTRVDRVRRRADLAGGVDSDLLALYDRVGAGPLQGRRCGACRIEIDRGELARVAAAADDDVLRCPECGAILLRVTGAAT